jgi:hypothetical protein
MSLVLSLGLAGGALMLAEMLDTSFHSVDELRQFTIIPVLVSVPKIVTRRRPPARTASVSPGRRGRSAGTDRDRGGLLPHCPRERTAGTDDPGER